LQALQEDGSLIVDGDEAEIDTEIDAEIDTQSEDA
jgi:hypothetical protein